MYTSGRKVHPVLARLTMSSATPILNYYSVGLEGANEIVLSQYVEARNQSELIRARHQNGRRASWRMNTRQVLTVEQLLYVMSQRL